MKTLMSVLLGAALLSSGQAQLLNQESLTGAALGAGAGAIIGNQYHGQSGEGAAIGAGVGYVLGQAVHYNRQQQYQDAAAAYPYNNYPYYGSYPPAYGNGYYASQPPPAYQPRRLNYAFTGAALGAGAGAIIGNQHHGQSGEGAAIGAAAGLLLGGLAEYSARRREKAQAAQWAAAQQVEAARQAAYATAQSQASSPPQSQSPVAQPTPPSKPSNNLQGANQLFGR